MHGHIDWFVGITILLAMMWPFALTLFAGIHVWLLVIVRLKTGPTPTLNSLHWTGLTFFIVPLLALIPSLADTINLVCIETYGVAYLVHILSASLYLNKKFRKKLESSERVKYLFILQPIAWIAVMCVRAIFAAGGLAI